MDRVEIAGSESEVRRREGQARIGIRRKLGGDVGIGHNPRWGSKRGVAREGGGGIGRSAGNGRPGKGIKRNRRGRPGQRDLACDILDSCEIIADAARLIQGGPDPRRDDRDTVCGATCRYRRGDGYAG